MSDTPITSEPSEEPDTESLEGLNEDTLDHYKKVSKRMYMFPSSLLKELNHLIDSDTVTSAAKLRDIMKDRYKGKIKIPSLTVIRGYVVLRQHQKQKIEEARQSLAESVNTVDTSAKDVTGSSQSIYQDLTLSVENKKTLLENLIKLCSKRIEAIKVLQEDDPSSSYETALGSYIREMRALTETLIKLRGELKTEGEQELDNYIGQKFADVLKVVVQAYSALHGQDKVDAFRSMIKAKLRENKLQIGDKA